MKSPTLILVLTAAVLVGVGVYLILERSLTRVLLGVVLIGNGANLIVLCGGGRAGGAPVIGVTPPGRMNDPLPQAMVLTAIVITLAVTAFVLSMAHRHWELTGTDEIQDDAEDLRVVRRAERGDLRAEHRRLRRELREQTAARRAVVRRLAVEARAGYAAECRRLGVDERGHGGRPEEQRIARERRAELRLRLRGIESEHRVQQRELRSRFRAARRELNRQARAERAAVARADGVVDAVPDTEFPRGATAIGSGHGATAFRAGGGGDQVGNEPLR
ncbi:Na(+)/H(+) antiporter subunit C [Embleya scabrispora]|uniref:Na(+)/H(+) antiporter subunit C n=1 Tax=Embleya scabrispora TaxID=159449 RepID=A0A1T3P651_9ACTN|nr:Na(+)/H(+) antiporter subunit C [Embleya scabrispora]OPC84579.1 Na(+)/H(+) antiporter subunit C [Embleya scabrispora]